MRVEYKRECYNNSLITDTNMNKKMKCFTCYYSQELGYLTRLHPDCKITGNSGSEKMYECTRCHRTFRGGLNGAIEWSDEMGPTRNMKNWKILQIVPGKSSL
jgi:hypothetical protein